MNRASREKLHDVLTKHLVNEITDILHDDNLSEKIRNHKITECVMIESAILNDNDFSSTYEELNYKVTIANLKLHGNNSIDEREFSYLYNLVKDY